MKTPLQVVFRDIAHSDAIESEIRRRADKIEQSVDSIISCRVTVGSSGRHKHQGVLRGVHIALRLPRSEIAVTRHHADEDIYVAIRDAFISVRRKVEEHLRREQGDVKTHAVPAHGRIVRLNPEGFGFIEDAEGSELYFARDNVVAPAFDMLEVGDQVQFIEAVGGDGPQAKRVTASRRRAD